VGAREEEAALVVAEGPEMRAAARTAARSLLGFAVAAGRPEMAMLCAAAAAMLAWAAWTAARA